MINYKSSSCPICGSKDWCGYRVQGDYTYYYCHRTAPPLKTIVNGYVCFKHTSECGVFVSLEQQERYFKEKNGHYSSTPMKSLNYEKKEEEKIVVRASANVIDLAYKNFISLLKLEESDMNYLLAEGWDEYMIKKNHIVSLPPGDHLRYESKVKSINPWRINICQKLIDMGIDLENVPGFGINKNGKWTFFGKQGIVFPVKNFKGQYTHLRIRPHYHEQDIQYYKSIDKKPPKYVFFSSPGRNGGAGCEIGYGVYIPEKPNSVCYITEGEKKAIVIAEKRNSIAIALQGVGSFRQISKEDEDGFSPLDYLQKMGIRTVAVALDADKAVNEHVLKAEEGIVDILKSKQFNVAVCNWNISLAKGIDDLIHLGLNPSISIV